MNSAKIRLADPAGSSARSAEKSSKFLGTSGLLGSRSQPRHIRCAPGPIDAAGRTTIVLDDGIATGSTMIAAAGGARLTPGEAHCRHERRIRGSVAPHPAGRR